MQIKKQALDVNRVKELLLYETETGQLKWKARKGKVLAGSVAGYASKNGYVQVTIDHHHCLAHRLVWAIVYGEWPSRQIDHIDRNPQNNQVENLRLCTTGENQQNVDVRAHNSTGVTGVYFLQHSKKWLAQITADGKTHHLGRFSNKEAAVVARKKAEIQLHPFRIVSTERQAV